MKPTINKNSGFTLVELVVAVAILGIVVAIALPTISNLKRNNETKKYTSYENSIISSSKLYMDSYDEDKFNKKDLTTQCAGITFDDLKSHNLLKEYNLDGVECVGTGDSNNIAAYVVRSSSGKYKYYPTIVCKKSGETIYQTKATTPAICKDVGKKVAKISGGNKCFPNKEAAKVTLQINNNEIEDYKYALIESTNSNNQEAIRNLEYKDIDTTENVIDLINVPQDRENKNYKLVLRYRYKDKGDIEYQYEVLNETISLNYKVPKIVVVAKKYEGAFEDSKVKEYEKYNFGDWVNTNVYVKATAKDSCGNPEDVILENEKKSNVNITKEGEYDLNFTTNNGGSKKVSVRIDKTPPTCSTKIIEGTEGENEWYISDVTIEGMCSDKGGSGCNNDQRYLSEIKDNTSGRNVSINVNDYAGNKGTCSQKVKIDKSKPSCSIKFGGQKSDYGWYNDSVEVILEPAHDGPKGPSPVHYFLDTYDYGNDKFASDYYNDGEWWQRYDTEGTTWYGYVKNEAGTTGKCNEKVKIDSVPPTCSMEITDGTKGENEWYRSDVTVKGTCLDEGGSGCVNTFTSESTIDHNTPGWTVTETVRDRAGNKVTCSKTVKIDKSKPSCSIKFEGKKGIEEWYRGSYVTVYLEPTRDGPSDLHYLLSTTDYVSYYDDEKVKKQWDETTVNGTTWYGHVKNEAGTTSRCDKIVKHDKTPPQPDKKLELEEFPGVKYLFGYSFTDTLSGLSTEGNSFRYAYSTYNYDDYNDFSIACGTTYEHSGLNPAQYTFAIEDTVNGEFKAGLSYWCVKKGYVKCIKGQFNICDKAGNCTDTGVLDYYK